MNALRVLFLAVVVTGTGCNCGGVLIDGSGVSKTETRDLDKQYHRVEVSGGLDLTLTDREPGTLSITTDDNLLDRIITAVGDDGALRIGVLQNANLSPHSGLTIEVSRKTVYEVGASDGSHVSSTGALECIRPVVSASGGSRVELDALAGTEEVVVWASGASQVKVRDVQAGKSGQIILSGGSQLDVASGSVATVTVQASGGSKLEAMGLATQTATLDISGGSIVNLGVTKSVSGGISGGSSVTVRGSPEERTVETSGGSSVSYEQ